MRSANSVRVAKSIKSKALKTWLQVRKKKRNWLDLPRDVMIHIFIKLGVVDLLHTAQKVCSLWRNLAKDPQIFRCIDMRNHWHVFNRRYYFDWFDFMVTQALSRCRDGELLEFSMEYFGTDWHIRRAIEKSRSKLRCLRLVSTDYEIKDDTLIEIAWENPFLEEIELSLCSFKADTIGIIGESCPHLKSFHLNTRGPYILCDDFHSDEEAYAIADNMPQLRRLHLFGNSLSNKGLQAILHKCPHLEYLDLRECSRLHFKGDLLQGCLDRVRDVRLPNDSTYDYEYDTERGPPDGSEESDMSDYQY